MDVPNKKILVLTLVLLNLQKALILASEIRTEDIQRKATGQLNK